MCYVVVDLEMCIIPKARRSKKYRWAHEIIQIGAVLLDKAYEVRDSFNMLVRPEYGIIDGNIEMLTGIRREMVRNAPDIRIALKAFADWIPTDAEFVTWSENDEMQIKREIEGKDIFFEGIEKFSGNWIDCQKTFSQIIKDTRKYKLEEALNLSDVDYDIHLHDGLVDASNTALLFRKMRTEKEYKFNTYYIDSKKEPEMLTSTLGELFSKIELSEPDEDYDNVKAEEKVVRLLNSKDMLLTTAESCTGGMIASEIVNVSGASKVFHQGYITYCDEAKNSILGVRKEVLQEYKAVSPQVAYEMAVGALKVSQADIAVSVTGVAGPSMEDGKPVGLVYIGVASGRASEYYNQNTDNKAASIEQLTETVKNGQAVIEEDGKYAVIKEFLFKGNRADVRKAACKEALKLICEYAEGIRNNTGRMRLRAAD